MLVLTACNSPLVDSTTEPDTPAPILSAGSAVRELAVNDFLRDYRIYTPESVNLNRPVSVMMVLHGEPRIDMAVVSGMNSHATARGFAAVYPNAAFEGDWVHACNCTANGVRGVNDVEYFEALLADLAIAFPAGLDRVFVSGFSEGGMMVFALACQIPERFDGFATVSASMWGHAVSNCLAKRPTPIVMINGNIDPRVPWEGAQVLVPFGTPQNVVGIVDNAGFWAGQNGCPFGPIIEELPDLFDDRTDVARWSWTDCDAPAVFYEIRGGGHTWPGMPISFDPSLGVDTRELDASTVMVDFLMGAGS